MPSVLQVHTMLVGAEPDEVAKTFYASAKRGFSDKACNQQRFLAVSMLTLAQVMRTGMATPSPVVMLIPPTHDKWVVKEFDDISARVFQTLKKMPGTSESRGRVARWVGDCFKIIFYNSRLLQLPEQPPSWTSFGFTREDPIPDWMRDGLL